MLWLQGIIMIYLRGKQMIIAECKCERLFLHPLALWVWFHKEKAGCLAKVINLSQNSSLHGWVWNPVDIDCSLICQVVKHIQCLNCWLFFPIQHTNPPRNNKKKTHAQHPQLHQSSPIVDFAINLSVKIRWKCFWFFPSWQRHKFAQCTEMQFLMQCQENTHYLGGKLLTLPLCL